MAASIEVRCVLPFWWEWYIWTIVGMQTCYMLEADSEVMIEFIMKHTKLETRLADGTWVTLSK